MCIFLKFVLTDDCSDTPMMFVTWVIIRLETMVFQYRSTGDVMTENMWLQDYRSTWRWDVTGPLWLPPSEHILHQIPYDITDDTFLFTRVVL